MSRYLVDLLGVGDASGGGVPFEALAGEALRETAEQEGLGDRALHFEVGERRPVRL